MIRVTRNGRPLRLMLFLSLAVLYGPGQAAAQTLYGEIVGNVRDASEAVVAGAAVTITNVNTNQSRQTVTNEVGGYSLPTVEAGTYTIRVTKEGFSATSQSNVVVSINTVTRVDVSLKIGATSETVNVTAETAALQTDRAEVRAEITSTSLQNLPVAGWRNTQAQLRSPPRFPHPCH